MIWLNADIRAAENAISANDRGLLLGEAVFETILLKHGIPQFWQAHLQRLYAACAAFELAPRFTADQLRKAMLALNDHNETMARAVLRLTVTAGAGGRGLVPQTDGQSNWLMQISPAPAVPETLQLVESDIVRLAGSVSTQHKTGAYLDNILARKQALKSGGDEALMRNQYGRFACAAAGNLWVQLGDQLITPPVSDGALPGIIRASVLADSTAGGLTISEALIDEDTLARADAIFISNSVNEFVAAGWAGGVNRAQKKQSRALCEALPQFDDF